MPESIFKEKFGKVHQARLNIVFLNICDMCELAFRATARVKQIHWLLDFDGRIHLVGVFYTDKSPSSNAK